jgi:hypothetical protein
MNPQWIRAVCAVIQAEGHVPMLFGHGQSCRRERDALPVYRDAPGIAPRCAVMLGLLGDIASLSPNVKHELLFAPGFAPRAYAWAAAQAAASAFGPLFEMVRDGRVPSLAHRHLATVFHGRWNALPADPPRCALAHIETG